MQYKYHTNDQDMVIIDFMNKDHNSKIKQSYYDDISAGTRE